MNPKKRKQLFVASLLLTDEGKIEFDEPTNVLLDTDYETPV